MPVVTCTKCPTQLRVPEGATGNVKCPKCKTIFPVNPKPAAAFEVVDEAPAKPAVPAARPAAAATRPAAAAAAPVARPAPPPPPPPAPAKKSEPEEDFNFDDDAPKKKRRGDDDEEDRDRKKKKRRDDDDEDDRPRSKRRRDDDDDDEDDRPRRKKRGRRDDYDDEDDESEDDYRRRTGKSSGFAASKTGVLLMGIGLWLYLGMYGLLALFFLIAMATSSMSEGLLAVPGLAGAACTVLLLVGLSFCIAGPAKARGLAIAAVSVAGVHLVLVIICYSKITGLGRGFGAMGGVLGGEWLFVGTLLWVLDLILPMLIYAPKGTGLGGEGILFVLAAACELTRAILVCLTIKAQATAAKDYYSAERAGMGVMLTAAVTGGAAIVVTLLMVIVIEGKMLSSAQYLMGLGGAAVCTGYALMTLPGALAAMSAKDSLARRARRG